MAGGDSTGHEHPTTRRSIAEEQSHPGLIARQVKPRLPNDRQEGAAARLARRRVARN